MTRWFRLFLLMLILGAPLPAGAAQIVAMDLQVGDGLPKRLAKALNPIFLTELSRRQGMSLISQDDVRALLELESNKQSVGCNDTKCMNEIAGSLGAELMATCQVARVGRSYVATMTLVSVERAKVIRRATGRAKGSEEAAAEAIASAVHSLFRDGLPTELQGPASLSRRGFEAAMAGFRQAVLERGVDPKPSRKRLILDLINTELDYDATPKMEALDLNIRRSLSHIRTLMLTSKNDDEREHYILGLGHYFALNDDLGRVKEIRIRARERGVVPSARPIRFLDPEPRDRPDPKRVALYRQNVGQPRQIVDKALGAAAKGDAKAMATLWKKDRSSGATRAVEEVTREKKRYGQRCELLPLHAMSPYLMRRAVEAMKDDSIYVYLRCFRRGEIYGHEYVRLERDPQAKNRWAISSW